MENCLGSDSVQFGEVALCSFADTLLFVTGNMQPDVMSYSYFYDLVALMDAVVDPQQSMGSHLKNEYEARRSDYTYVQEASTNASFSHITPVILSGGSSGKTVTSYQPQATSRLPMGGCVDLLKGRTSSFVNASVARKRRQKNVSLSSSIS